MCPRGPSTFTLASSVRPMLNHECAAHTRHILSMKWSATWIVASRGVMYVDSKLPEAARLQALPAIYCAKSHRCNEGMHPAVSA